MPITPKIITDRNVTRNCGIPVLKSQPVSVVSDMIVSMIHRISANVMAGNTSSLNAVAEPMVQSLVRAKGVCANSPIWSSPAKVATK